MAKQKKAESLGIGREIIAVSFSFIAIFLFISLISFSHSAQIELFSKNTGNWGGAIGNFTANLLAGMLGVSSFWLVFLLLYFSFSFLFHRQSTERLPYVLLGISGILISSSAIFAVISPDTFFLLGLQYPGSGSVGMTLFHYLMPFLGKPGFFLIFVMLMLISIMISFEISLYHLMGYTISCCRTIMTRVFDSSTKRISELNITEKVKGNESSTKRIELKPKEPKLHEPVDLEEEKGKDFQPLPVVEGDFALPSVTLLQKPEINLNAKVDRDHYLDVSKKLEEKFNDFAVEGNVIGISPGPVVTTYEFSPAPGVKISKIVSLEDDLALCLKKESVRIVGSVPGKAALGIEIPNPIRNMVYIREILANEKFINFKSPLSIGLGKDVIGNPVYADLADMPHLLIAGATGAGKSVGINTIICSILLKASPDQVRLLMVDPKRIELSAYDNIPHLLHPVVVDPKMASRALQWAVMEMERRYGLMEDMRVKNINTYNAVAAQKLPLIVIIIDELADLMMVASKDVESSVARLAQMARAAGMHLILATQRPSVDVLTGLIKANFPTRMSFKVSSKIDSRTILDGSGAEHLLGKGDMLFSASGNNRLQRIHAAYISEQEIERIVSFLKEQRTAIYDESVLKIAEGPEDGNSATLEEDYDEKYDEAVEFVCESGQASISMVQRRLRVGYNRAARMIEVMEKEGIVGPSDGSKPREVLARKTY